MNCWGCNADLEHLDFCPRCGRIQPMEKEDLEYFRALGFSEPVLDIDEKALEEIFHSKSRRVHPDRFQLREPKELEISLQRSAILNEAYRTLRNKKSRARYVLGKFGGEKADPKNVPAELAELYFDLRDVLEEAGQTERLRKLKGELESKRKNLERRLDELSGDWDRSHRENDPARKTKVLRELQNILHQDNYADSMLKDLGRCLGEEGDFG